MTDSGAMPGGGGAHGGSKGVAVTNWLVQKASGLLERKTSRRGFIMGTAMAGSAVAVAGCVPATTPGSFYTHITDCSGGLCTDGYTDFCCTLNQGVNACPPNSFWGGWWRADYSSFCNGTRYYIDCMQNCCGPSTGFQNFCAGCEECRCAGGCDTRRVYCNYFRYGQCHTDIVATGPIACRVVTCVPPYVADPECSTATLVDNSTAEHTSPCITTPRALVASGAGAVAPDSRVLIFSRAFSGRIQTSTFDGANWSGFTEIAPSVTSGLAAAADGTSVYVFGRGSDNILRYNRWVGGVWTGEGALAGLGVVADPAVCVNADGVHVFIRSVNNGIFHGVMKDGAFSGWEYVGGQTSSNPVAGASPDGVFVVVRGTDGAPWAARKVGAAAWQPFQSLGGSMKGAPGVAGSADGLHVFIRGGDDALWVRGFSGGWSPSWQRLGGYLIGDPVGVGDDGGNYCLLWGVEETPRYVRHSGGGWTPITVLPGQSSALPIGFTASGGPWVLVRGTDNAHWVGHLAGTSWSGFRSLGGVDVSVTALGNL